MPQSNGPAATLWYLAPGLAHQLGNALFTLQGRARLLAAADPARVADDCRAIQEGVDRASAGLNLLRWLLEEHRPAPVPIGVLLHSLAEVVRVPLRDRGIGFEIHATAEAVAPPVDPGPVCQLLTTACRLLAAHLPGMPPGRMALAWTPIGGELRLQFRLQPATGESAFPRDPARTGEALQAELAAAQARWDAGGDDDALVLFVPIARPTFRAS